MFGSCKCHLTNVLERSKNVLGTWRVKSFTWALSTVHHPRTLSQQFPYCCFAQTKVMMAELVLHVVIHCVVFVTCCAVMCCAYPDLPPLINLFLILSCGSCFLHQQFFIHTFISFSFYNPWQLLHFLSLHLSWIRGVVCVYSFAVLSMTVIWHDMSCQIVSLLKHCL